MGSEITFGELAHKVGLGETHIKKLVRHAITQKIFSEPRSGVIAHTACSRLIAEDDVFYSCKKQLYVSLSTLSPVRGVKLQFTVHNCVYVVHQPYYSKNPCSRVLIRVDTDLQYQLGHMWPAAVSVCDAVEQWPGSEEPNQTVRGV